MGLAPFDNGDGAVGIRTLINNLITFGEFLYSACKTDGTEQGAVFAAEVAEAVAGGKTLILPAGTINLSSITTPINVTGSLSLASFVGTAILSGWNGSSGLYSGLLNLQSGDFTFDRIGFSFWGPPIYSNSTIGKLHFTNCLLQNNREHVKQDLSSLYPASYVDDFKVIDTDIIDSPGFAIEGNIGSAYINGNKAERVWRNPAHYDYTTTNSYFLYAFCIGDHDNAPAADGQAMNTSVIFTNNRIHGVYNGSTAPSGNVLSSHGVNITATGVIVENNYMRDFSSGLNDAFDTSAFYCKAVFGTISNNTFSSSTLGRPVGVVDPNTIGGSAMMSIKGTSQPSNQPDAKQLRISGNVIKGAATGVISIGIWVYGSATDVTLEGNEIYDMPDGAIKVTNSALRVHTYRNKAVRCGGIPILYQCSDITNCNIIGNDISDQVLPTSAYASRPMNPYATGSNFNAQAICLKTAAGVINAINIVSPGSGYLVNGSPNGGCYITVTGGVGGGTEKVYAYFSGGQLVAIAAAGLTGGFTTAPTVTPITANQAGFTITNTGSEAVVTMGLSLGALIDVHVNDTRVSGNLVPDGTLATLIAYDCLAIYNNSSAAAKNVNVDKLTAVVDGTSSFSVVGLNMYGPSSVTTGSADNIEMLGDNSSRRQQPWRASNSASISKFSAMGVQFKLGDAKIGAGIVQPQPLLYVGEGKGRIIVAFDRFTSGNNFIGQIIGGQAVGAVRITEVTPRYVLQSGGSALAAASGSPTVAIGVTSGGGELVAATAIGSISSVTSPVDGTIANEVAPPSGLDISLYLNIAGGTITSNTKAHLVVDFTYTVLI